MNTRGKRIWLALAVGVIAAVASLLVWDSVRRGPPQIVTLNGRQYRLAGVSYGTNHVQPTFAAGLINRAPSSVSNFVQGVLGKHLGPVAPFLTSEPSLCVWFKASETKEQLWGGSTVFAMLADKNGVVAGDRSDIGRIVGGLPCSLVVFRVVPRRSPMLELRFLGYTQRDVGGPYSDLGRIRFPNPLFGKYPQWQPEALPAVKKAGDLEVRLEKFDSNGARAGARLAFRDASPKAQWGWDEGTDAAFQLILNPWRGTNVSWGVQGAELSDATGNRIQATRVGRSTSGDVFVIAPDLWPAEAALRLRLELKRNYGFAPAELVTFRNVPVPKAGVHMLVPLTNFVGGVEVVLVDFDRLNPLVGTRPFSALLRATLPGDARGQQLELVNLATDAGEQWEKYHEVSGASNQTVFLNALSTNVQTVDITWAVQKTRTVEFLVKPPKAE